jgi:diguanylate cyclase (GGDEF)-like protein
MAIVYHSARPLALAQQDERLSQSPALRRRAMDGESHRSGSGSRLGAFLCIGGSTLICAASLAWILASPLDESIPPTVFHARLLWGALGAVLSLAVGVGGIALWPRRTRRRARSRDAVPSTYDSMTGLPTQRLFFVLLSQALARSKTTNRGVAVLVIALEACCRLAAGNVLRNVTLVVRVQAARIKGALQSHDTVARLAEDRFAVILDGVESAERVRSIADNIQRAMSLPLVVEGQELLLSCRIGAALALSGGAESQTLLAEATQALADSQSADVSIKVLSDVTALTSFARPAQPVVLPSDDQRSDAVTSHR